MEQILIFDILESEHGAFAKDFEGKKVLFYSHKLTKNFLLETAEIDRNKVEVVSMFTHSKITREIIDTLPSLKLIAARSVGYDNIDMLYCREKGITVCNVPTYGGPTVAEFTLGLILSLLRKIPQSVIQTREGNFSRNHLEGTTLFGKTVGVIGEGNIGKQVISLLHGFGAKIVVFTKTPDKTFEKSYDVLHVSLEKLLSISDIITLHVPLNDSTLHMLNNTTIPLIRRGAFLVNTSRGEVIQTEALLAALESGILEGVALDVLEEEPEINSRLLKHPRVLVTPHNAFNTTEALKDILLTTSKNIEYFLAGKPINVIC